MKEFFIEYDRRELLHAGSMVSVRRAELRQMAAGTGVSFAGCAVVVGLANSYTGPDAFTLLVLFGFIVALVLSFSVAAMVQAWRAYRAARARVSVLVARLAVAS